VPAAPSDDPAESSCCFNEASSARVAAVTDADATVVGVPASGAAVDTLDDELREPVVMGGGLVVGELAG
jgi:hypothetical protein